MVKPMDNLSMDSGVEPTKCNLQFSCPQSLLCLFSSGYYFWKTSYTQVIGPFQRCSEKKLRFMYLNEEPAELQRQGPVVRLQ